MNNFIKGQTINGPCGYRIEVKKGWKVKLFIRPLVGRPQLHLGSTIQEAKNKAGMTV